MHNPPMLSPRLACLAVVAAALSIVVSGCNGATDDRPATWSFISATITEPSCATVNCHSAITHQGGVDLSAREIGYQTLVGTQRWHTSYYVYPGYPAGLAGREPDERRGVDPHAARQPAPPGRHPADRELDQPTARQTTDLPDVRDAHAKTHLLRAHRRPRPDRPRRCGVRLSAVSVLVGDHPVQPVPLRSRGRRSHHLLGARRVGRHHQPRR